MSFISPEERELIAYRDSVNWRSVTRADPAVVQIINTCTFATIYIFDTGRDEWVKQKQEGPLFLVKRNKEPEYGLYMLNRAIVKNVLLPLIPGEIRVTPTSDSMLIVEKRGEGVKRGIHFGDGMTVVDQFRESIISICGDVRAKTVNGDRLPGHSKSEPPILTQSQSTAPVSQGAPVGVEDDFQRLFGNLLKSSTSSKSTTSTSSYTHSQPQSQTQSLSHSRFNTASPPAQPQTQVYRNSSSTPPVPPPASSRPPPPPSLQSQQPEYRKYQPQHLQRPVTPPSPPITFSDPVVQSPSAPSSRSPVPQTADDLLNSILGVAPLPPRPQPPVAVAPQIVGSTAPPVARTPPLRQPLATSVSQGQSSQHLPAGISPAPSPVKQQRIRDRPPHLDHPQLLPPPSASSPLPVPAQPQLHTTLPPQTQDPHLGPGLQGNGLLEHRAPLVDAITTSLPHNFSSGINGDPRLAFKLDLLDLIQRDPGFVDHLFRAFQARRGAGG